MNLRTIASQTRSWECTERRDVLVITQLVDIIAVRYCAVAEACKYNELKLSRDVDANMFGVVTSSAKNVAGVTMITSVSEGPCCGWTLLCG